MVYYCARESAFSWWDWAFFHIFVGYLPHFLLGCLFIKLFTRFLSVIASNFFVGFMCFKYTVSVCSLVAQAVKSPPTTQKTWLRSLGWEDPLEKGMAIQSSILAWRIPWTESYSLWGCKELDTTEWLSTSHSGLAASLLWTPILKTAFVNKRKLWLHFTGFSTALLWLLSLVNKELNVEIPNGKCQELREC